MKAIPSSITTPRLANPPITSFPWRVTVTNVPPKVESNFADAEKPAWPRRRSAPPR